MRAFEVPRFSVNQSTTFRWQLEEDLHFYRKAGFDAVGVWRRKLDDCGIEKSLDALTESGLGVTSLMWAGGFTGSEGLSFDQAMADAFDAVQQAAELKADCLIVHPGGRNHHLFRHAERLLRSAFDKLVPLAEEHGVVLAIEPMPLSAGSDCTFLSNIESAIELIEDYDSPALKMTMDICHFPAEATDPDLLAEIADRLAVVLVADQHETADQAVGASEQDHCLLGHGNTPLKEAFLQIMRAGYQGSFEVKLSGSVIEAVDNDFLVQHSLNTMTLIAEEALNTLEKAEPVLKPKSKQPIAKPSWSLSDSVQRSS